MCIGSNRIHTRPPAWPVLAWLLASAACAIGVQLAEVIAVIIFVKVQDRLNVSLTLVYNSTLPLEASMPECSSNGQAETRYFEIVKKR